MVVQSAVVLGVPGWGGLNFRQTRGDVKTRSDRGRNRKEKQTGRERQIQNKIYLES